MTTTAFSPTTNVHPSLGAANQAGTAGAKILHFEVPTYSAAPKEDGFADLLAEMEADPVSAQALSDGRRWVAEQFYAETQTLSALRLSAGLSQKQLGHATGMKQAHISRYEAGSLEPRLRTAHVMAQALGVDLDTYFKAWDATQAQQQQEAP